VGMIESTAGPIASRHVKCLTAARNAPAATRIGLGVVSTEGSKTRIERLLALGVRFIHKPFTPGVVREVVQGIMGVCHDQPA